MSGRVLSVPRNTCAALSNSTSRRQGFPSLSWYDVLLELKRSETGCLRPFELERQLLLTQYDLSRLLDRIVKAGYAEKRPLNEDRRGHLLALTATREDLIGRMWPVYRSSIEKLASDRLTNEEARSVAALLSRLYNDA
jgi:DNA-binding MarR family transcriptional regulator